MVTKCVWPDFDLFGVMRRLAAQEPELSVSWGQTRIADRALREFLEQHPDPENQGSPPDFTSSELQLYSFIEDAEVLADSMGYGERTQNWVGSPIGQLASGAAPRKLDMVSIESVRTRTGEQPLRLKGE